MSFEFVCSFVDSSVTPEYEECDGIGVEEIESVALEDEAVQDDNEFQKSKKKKGRRRSIVWNHVKLVSPPGGVERYECKWCNIPLSKQNRNSTTHMLRHLREHCPHKFKIFPPGEALDVSKLTEGQSSIANFRFDFARVKELAGHMVLAHEYSLSMVDHKVFNAFLKAYSPFYRKISRCMVRKECFLVYEKEKVKISNLLAKVERISLTTDCWTSDSQKIGYMVVTAHFIDGNWNLQKRVLAFKHVPPPHNGVNLALEVHKVAKDYGIRKKVVSVTVDNASANDSCIEILKSDYDEISNLVLDGKLFHVRCCAHIINLLVRDGLKEIENVIDIVREGIKYLFGSERRLAAFNEHRINLMLPPNKLVVDNNTRWNSTFIMLNTAYTYRKCFTKFGEEDEHFKIYVPSQQDWEEVYEVCEFLEVFYDVTKLISGSNYPILLELSRIKHLINDQMDDSKKKHMKFMALRMASKYDKYWGHCNLLLSFGSMLDPRYKKGMIHFAFNGMFLGDAIQGNIQYVESKFEELYDQYAKVFGDDKQRGGAAQSGTTVKQSQPLSSSIGKRKFDAFMMQQQSMGKEKTDLELYFEEPCHPNEARLDILHYWKVHEGKFKVLSKMAKDILSIPITTVASESTFSAGGRVIDKRRASMRVDTVEVLLCAGDWIKEAYGVRSEKYDEDDPDFLKFFKEYEMADKNSTVPTQDAMTENSVKIPENNPPKKVQTRPVKIPQVPPKKAPRQSKKRKS